MVNKENKRDLTRAAIKSAINDALLLLPLEEGESVRVGDCEFLVTFSYRFICKSTKVKLSSVKGINVDDMTSSTEDEIKARVAEVVGCISEIRRENSADELRVLARNKFTSLLMEKIPENIFGGDYFDISYLDSKFYFSYGIRVGDAKKEFGSTCVDTIEFSELNDDVIKKKVGSVMAMIRDARRFAQIEIIGSGK